MKFNDLTNQKFGALLVIKRAPNIGKSVAWECQCDCGTITIKKSTYLTIGDTTSCGCRINTIGKDPKISTARHIWKSKYSDGNLTIDDFVRLTQMNCYYCNLEPSNCYNLFSTPSRIARRQKESIFANEQSNFIYNGLDRIDPSQPHNLDNVVPCCKHCNVAKLAMTSEEFKTWLKRAASFYLYKISSVELDKIIQNNL